VCRYGGRSAATYLGLAMAQPFCVVDQLRARPPGQSQENMPLANPFRFPFLASLIVCRPPPQGQTAWEGTGAMGVNVHDDEVKVVHGGWED
jgi:hypothetical protein